MSPDRTSKELRIDDVEPLSKKSSQIGSPIDYTIFTSRANSEKLEQIKPVVVAAVAGAHAVREINRIIQPDTLNIFPMPRIEERKDQEIRVTVSDPHGDRTVVIRDQQDRNNPRSQRWRSRVGLPDSVDIDYREVPRNNNNNEPPRQLSDAEAQLLGGFFAGLFLSAAPEEKLRNGGLVVGLGIGVIALLKYFGVIRSSWRDLYPISSGATWRFCIPLILSFTLMRKLKTVSLNNLQAGSIVGNQMSM